MQIIHKRLQQFSLIAVGLLVALFCVLTIIGHAGTEQANAANQQTCAAACHNHSQGLPGDGASVRQNEKENQDPTPPPFAYWSQFNIQLYLLLLYGSIPAVSILFWQNRPVFLRQQALRF